MCRQLTVLCPACKKGIEHYVDPCTAVQHDEVHSMGRHVVYTYADLCAGQSLRTSTGPLGMQCSSCKTFFEVVWNEKTGEPATVEHAEGGYVPTKSVELAQEFQW